MPVKRIGVVVSLMIALLAACGRAPQMASSDMAGAPMLAEPVEMERAVEESAAGIVFDDDANFAESALVIQDIPQERIIIRTADMSIVVVDTESAMDTIAQMAAENGGWVVESHVFQYSENAMTGNMSVRIPSTGFDSFIEAIRRLAVDVDRVSTTGQDVTEEYVDLSARLENLEATAERVRAFLDEAKTVEEALEVNRELSRLEGEIESLKGRLQYLEQSAAFSLITIALTPDELSQPIAVNSWQPQGVARNALETLIDTLQTLVDVAIWLLIYILPIALLVGLPLWLVIRFIRRRRRQRMAADDVVKEEANGEPVDVGDHAA